MVGGRADVSVGLSVVVFVGEKLGVIVSVIVGLCVGMSVDVIVDLCLSARLFHAYSP